MALSDAWDWVTEKFSEGWEEFIGLFSGMFSNLKEFSIPGAVAGGIMVFLLFLARGMVLTPFTSRMGAAQGLITSVICYVAVFAVGYLMAKKAFEGN